MFSIEDYDYYAQECERWAHLTTNEGEKALYLAMAQAARCAAMAKQDVLGDPAARYYTPKYIH